MTGNGDVAVERDLHSGSSPWLPLWWHSKSSAHTWSHSHTQPKSHPSDSPGQSEN